MWVVDQTPRPAPTAIWLWSRISTRDLLVDVCLKSNCRTCWASTRVVRRSDKEEDCVEFHQLGMWGTKEMMMGRYPSKKENRNVVCVARDDKRLDSKNRSMSVPPSKIQKLKSVVISFQTKFQKWIPRRISSTDVRISEWAWVFWFRNLTHLRCTSHNNHHKRHFWPWRFHETQQQDWRYCHW